MRKNKRISNLLKKVKSVFKKESNLEKDIHTYGSAFSIILGSHLPKEIKVKKLKHLRECVSKIAEKRLKGITDPSKRKEKGKDYRDLMNKIFLAEMLMSK